MAKKTCSRGHIYDPAIYGENCPFCPQSTVAIPSYGSGTVGNFGSGGTELNQVSGGTIPGGTIPGGTTPIGPTIPMGGGNYGGGGGIGTVIRPVNPEITGPSGRRITGLFVTYDTKPEGEVFHILEGRNYIGRDTSSDISIQLDSQISGKHFSVLYRVADGKFKFRDEQSSNGTFLNEVLTDEGELNTFDIIRIGQVRLVFIAIPQIP